MILKYLELYVQELFKLTTEMAPYLLLGFLFAGILHVFFKKEQVARLLGSKKVKSSVYASLIGVPLPLCSCGVIPTGVSIYKSGASKGSTVSFLISTPQTGIDSILATYSMLGLPYAILRPFIAFVSGILGGTITNYIDKETEQEPTKAFSKENSKKIKNPVGKMLHYAFVESLQDIAKWLIIGLMIAALISLLLPPDFFQTYINNDLLGMLIVLAIAVPLYICATGSIPIAAVLLLKGISPGAALVFLMAGPATNAATITVLGKVMGKKALFGYLVSIIGSALIFGILIDNLLPREWFTSNLNSQNNHSDHGLPYWFELTSVILLLILLSNIFIKRFSKFFKRPNSYTPQVNSINSFNLYTYIRLKGMDCNGCKANVERTLLSIKGVETAEGNIEKSIVKIKTSGFDLNQVKTAIESLGHSYLGVVPVENKNNGQYKIVVKGMTCNHCKANVEKTIKEMQHVSDAVVDLDKSLVLVDGENIDLNELKKRVEDIGYEYGGILIHDF